jgi:hypothetical protein
MTPKRIKEIQKETAYPNSISVQSALLQVWNECEQEQQFKNCNLQNVSTRFNWNQFFIGYLVGVLVAFIIAMIVF